MSTSKISTLTFRIDPRIKEALRTAAEHEHRSLANMVEILIREHCSRSGIAIAGESHHFDKSRKPTKRAR